MRRCDAMMRKKLRERRLRKKAAEKLRSVENHVQDIIALPV
jgi:hypothetical protein